MMDQEKPATYSSSQTGTTAERPWYDRADEIRNRFMRAETYFKPFRDARKSHLEAVAGRWYDKHAHVSRIGHRPLNLIGQAFFAYCGTLTPQSPQLDVIPREPIYTMEAQVLAKLLERQFADMNATRDVYAPVIGDALVSPVAITYTGRQGSNATVSVDGMDVDPGDSFISHVPFSSWVCDPSATEFRARAWEAHVYTDSRQRLMNEPAYAEHREQLEKLENAAQSRSGSDRDGRNQGASDVDNDDAIELINLVCYHNGRVYERTVTYRGGTALLLRSVTYSEVGPDNGPYDHLMFYPLPGWLLGPSPVGMWRDACDIADGSAAKLMRQFAASKKLVIGSDEKKLAGIKSAQDLSTILGKPDDVTVIDLMLVQQNLGPMLDWMISSANTAAGNVQMMRGLATDTGQAGKTATGMSILQQKNAQTVGTMQASVLDLMSRHGHKLAHWLWTDPVSVHEVSMESRDMTYSMGVPPELRMGTPRDFTVKVVPRLTSAMDPAVRVAAMRELFAVIGELMPLFQMGLLRPLPTIRILQREYGVTELDAMLGIDEFTQEGGQVAMDAQQRAMVSEAMARARGGGGGNGGGAVASPQESSVGGPLQRYGIPQRSQAMLA